MDQPNDIPGDEDDEDLDKEYLESKPDGIMYVTTKRKQQERAERPQKGARRGRDWVSY